MQKTIPHIPYPSNDAAAGDTQPDGLSDAQKINAPAMAKLIEFLRRYTPSAERSEADLLQERFRIDLATPLAEFNVQTAEAYTASDAMEPSKQLFAHVCGPDKVQRHRAIQQLKALEHSAIVDVVAAGPVILSSSHDERFVIFYERPTGRKLSELLAEKKISTHPQFICEHIIAPLALAIGQFAELGIAHGMINPDNIYFDDHAMLGPCVAEPSGYSQHFAYESLERMQAMPSAKGEGSVAQDYYALAVTVLYILFGPEHFSRFSRESLIRSILRESAYNALTQQKDVPEIFYDFFRGMLTQSSNERWNDKQLKAWLSGKRYHVLPPPPPSEAMRPFEFGETSANTRRELAQLFASDWEHMIASLQNNQLAHWVSVSLRDKELAEIIARMSRGVTETSIKNETHTNELLMNIVLLLDPQGPVRIKHLAMHVDGIDALCAELHGRKSHHELQLLARFIESNMVNYWLEIQNKTNEEYKISYPVNAIIIKLDRLRGCIRNTGFGFGLERMLYELNPDMPCLSPMLAHKHVTTLPALLTQLDRMAYSLSKEDPIDRHIAAFIASKLGIQHEIRLHELTAVPALATNRTMMALYLLSMAQQKVGDLRLPGLTHWLSLHLLPLMERIHSRTLREQIKSLLMDLTPLGYTQQMAELVITADYATADQAGFNQALMTYRVNAAHITSYQKAERIEEESFHLGYTMAKALAYAALLLSFINIVRGAVL